MAAMSSACIVCGVRHAANVGVMIADATFEWPMPIACSSSCVMVCSRSRKIGASLQVNLLLFVKNTRATVYVDTAPRDPCP